MPECELMRGCSFFNDQMAELPGLTCILKQRFCRESFERCARFQVRKALGIDGVPADLYPPQLLRAGRLIAQADQHRR
jgi:hypothetical protein